MIIRVDWPMDNAMLRRSASHKNVLYKMVMCGGKYAMWLKLAAPIEVIALAI